MSAAVRPAPPPRLPPPTTTVPVDPSPIRAWLRLHARALATAADLLRSLPFVSRTPHAELYSALLTALFALLRLVRDYPPALDAPPSVRNHPRRVLLLELLRAIELPLEMLVSRNHTPPRDSPAHLPAVAAVETAKAALKLSLLPSSVSSASSGAMQTPAHLSLPESEPPPVCTCALADVPEAADVSMCKGPRTDRAILALRAARRAVPTRPQRRLSRAVIAGLSPPPSAGSLIGHVGANDADTDTDGGTSCDPVLDALFVVAYERRSNWLMRMFLPDMRCAACDAPLQLPPRPPLSESVTAAGSVALSLNAREVAAEVAHIARPVLHLALIRRLGWTSWRAWALALLLDVAARLMVPAPTDGPARVERRRRLALLLLYLGRSPLFDVVLRAVVRRVTDPMRRVPVVGGVAAAVVQWGTLLQQYWFYTSGS